MKKLQILSLILAVLGSASLVALPVSPEARHLVLLSQIVENAYKVSPEHGDSVLFELKEDMENIDKLTRYARLNWNIHNSFYSDSHNKVVSELLENRVLLEAALMFAETRTRTDMAKTILHSGYFHPNYADTVPLLLDNTYAKINCNDKISDATPLSSAVRSIHAAKGATATTLMKNIEALIDGGADVTVRCMPGGLSLLGYAAKNDMPYLAKALMRGGANPTTKVDGYSALDFAQSDEMKEILQGSASSASSSSTNNEKIH